MNFDDFQFVVSADRLKRYIDACGGCQEKTLQLYRLNIRVSLEMFAVVGAFEIALRNTIDRVMKGVYGLDWLRDSISENGFFNVIQCRDHAQIIRSAYNKLSNARIYSHNNLLAKMEFGIWKYMFSSPQFRASGRILLRVFPNKPTSTRYEQYNNTTIFNELDHVNSLRNRIAHHEPICFPTGQSEITTDYIVWINSKILTLFDWMGINKDEYLKGISNLAPIIAEINRLKD